MRAWRQWPASSLLHKALPESRSPHLGAAMEPILPGTTMDAAKLSQTDAGICGQEFEAADQLTAGELLDGMTSFRRASSRT